MSCWFLSPLVQLNICMYRGVLSCTTGYYIKGVVYSSRPRAEVDGSAVFTDLKHGIRAVLRFGPNKGARAPILRRSDAIIGEIYEVAKDSVTTLVSAILI